jgi:hypothetical protein
MVDPDDYAYFYGKLFEPVAKEYGAIDRDAIVAIVGFDCGGPLNFSTRIDKGLYVSCELCCRDDQTPASFGNYELMAIGSDIEQWVRRVLTRIGVMSLEEAFDHHHTLDISAWVDEGSSIVGIIFEKYSSIMHKGGEYGIMRVIGVTAAELNDCYEMGVEHCIQRLKDSGVYPRTLLSR